VRGVFVLNALAPVFLQIALLSVVPLALILALF
jgi:hypothetical protein